MDEDDPLVDTVVDDRYRVVRKLGEGAMSIVYEVQHTKLARSFAIGRIAMVHRLGRIDIGEASVVVIVTAPHRKPA